MKKTLFLIPFILVSVITAQWKDLTLEDVFKKPPFKLASIGQWQWVPESDEYLFFNMDTSIIVKSLYKYDLVSGDTTLYIPGDKLAFQGKALHLADYEIHQKSNKMLLITGQKRIWRHSRVCHILFI